MRVLNLVTNQNAGFYEQQVASLARQGVEQTTLAVPGQRRVSDDAEESRSILDYLRFYPPALRRGLDGYDVVHANYGLTAPAALAQPTRPVVLSCWGSDLLGRYGAVVRWCASRADAVIVMSEEMADLVDADCHVIPHGVDLSLFRPMPQQPAREAVGWRADAKQVLFPYSPGRAIKDYPRAERVVSAVDERLDADVELQTLSGVPHERMPVYMNAADSLLLTSHHEGSPNSVKEAMAVNLPVVATDVGDVRERLDGVAPSRVAGSDEDLIDGLAAVLERGPPSNGRAAIEPLGLDRMGERILSVYDSVR